MDRRAEFQKVSDPPGDDFDEHLIDLDGDPAAKERAFVIGEVTARLEKIGEVERATEKIEAGMTQCVVPDRVDHTGCDEAGEARGGGGAVERFRREIPLGGGDEAEKVGGIGVTQDVVEAARRRPANDLVFIAAKRSRPGSQQITDAVHMAESGRRRVRPFGQYTTRRGGFQWGRSPVGGLLQSKPRRTYGSRIARFRTEVCAM